MLSVLIVEDEALVALTMEDVLIEAGYRVAGIADRPEAALAIARRDRPDIAVVDVRLAEGGDGITLADALMLMAPMRILFATANSADVRVRAQCGQGCLSKPFQAGWLLAALDAVWHGAAPEIPGFFALPVAQDLR